MSTFQWNHSYQIREVASTMSVDGMTDDNDDDISNLFTDK